MLNNSQELSIEPVQKSTYSASSKFKGPSTIIQKSLSSINKQFSVYTRAIQSLLSTVKTSKYIKRFTNNYKRVSLLSKKMNLRKITKVVQFAASTGSSECQLWIYSIRRKRHAVMLVRKLVN